MDERTFRKRLYAIVGCITAWLIAMVLLFVKGVLSPREFGVAGLIMWVGGFAAFYALIKSRQRADKDLRAKQIASGVPAEAIDRDRYIKNIRAMKRLIALFVVLFIYGTLESRGAPLLPRAAGASVDLLILAGCARSLIRSQRRLKELSAEGTAGPQP